MGQSAEWFHVDASTAAPMSAGEGAGDGHLTRGEFGVKIMADEIAVIYGDDPDALVDFCERLLEAAQEVRDEWNPPEDREKAVRKPKVPKVEGAETARTFGPGKTWF